MTLSWETLLIVAAATFLFAGTIKGTVGIGLPTATVGILSQFVDPRQAIALLLLPALVTNTWQTHRSQYFKRGFDQLWPFTLAMMVMILVFTQFAAVVPAEVLMASVGCAVVIFVATHLLAKPFQVPANQDKSVQFVTGGIAGFMGGLTSIWAPPMVIYLMTRDLSKDDFVGALGFIILAGTIPLTLGYLNAGLLTSTLAIYSALMIVPTWLGFVIGEQLRRRLDGDQFRNALLLVFFLMGLNLIRRGLT